MASHSRRQFLLATTSGAIATLAGCSALGSQNDDTTTPTTTDEETTTPTTTDEGATATTSSSETTTSTTEESTASPGDQSGEHWHGTLFFEVNDERVNFEQSKYEELDEKFHFASDGDRYKWHNELETVTLQYALNTLPDIEYRHEGQSHIITFRDTTYRSSDSDTSITTIRGETNIDPWTYTLRDGDVITVRINTDTTTTNGTNTT
jgi:hypothetical protein